MPANCSGAVGGGALHVHHAASSPGNTGPMSVYAQNMAKVMIGIPDELLGRLDDHARRSGTTRSGLLRDLAERELHADSRRRAISTVLATASPHGGESARRVRELRQSR
jgi:Ribbon-helix-helix protein, copG family